MRNADPSFWKDRVALVTGASSGIGRALARQLAAAGARVAVLARRHDLLDTLAAEIGPDHVLLLPGDVADEARCRSAVAETVARLGRLDVLVNNAGVSMNARLEEADGEVFRQMMAVNYFGSLYMTKAALPHLRRAGGSVVFVTSVVGKRGFATRSGYAAAKFAVQGLFESLRVELADKSVHVGLVCPGYTETEIRSTALGPDARPRGQSGFTTGSVMSADEAARAIVDCVERRRREVVLTAGGRLMVWLNRLCPALAERVAARVVA